MDNQTNKRKRSNSNNTNKKNKNKKTRTNNNSSQGQSTTTTTTTSSTISSTAMVPFDPKKPFTEANVQETLNLPTLPIGRGTYGNSFYFVYRKRAFVRKVINITDPYHKASYYNETACLKLLRSEGKYFPFMYSSYALADEQTGNIVLEYISGVPLSVLLRILRSDTRGLLPFEIDALIYQIREALDTLHQEFRMLHLDLKPGNIMVRFHNNVILGIVIIDFGFSKLLGEGNSVRNIPYPGTLRYANPALLNSYTKYASTAQTSQTPMKYNFTIADNVHSAQTVYQEIRLSLETNVDTKPKLGKFNYPCHPRFNETTINESLINAACIFANQGTLSGLACAERILAIPHSNLTVNTKDSAGDTLLHSALYNIDFQAEAIQLLINLGADPNIENIQGQNAIDILNHHIEEIQENIQDLKNKTDKQSKNSRTYFQTLLQKLHNTKAFLSNTTTILTTTTTSSSINNKNNI